MPTTTQQRPKARPRAEATPQYKTVIVKIMRKCRGYNPKTGRRVGERHRWSGAKWGEGTCIWCHRTIESVYEKETRRRRILPDGTLS